MIKNKLKIKVCGMRDFDNITQLCDLNPDYIGFIFYSKSKRYVDENINKTILSAIPIHTKKVGVFVNKDIEELKEIVKANKLDVVQLHGDESPEYCQELTKSKIQIIKAFRIGQSFNFKTLNNYKAVVDYFLFDTLTEDYGGSGKKFSWDILKEYDNEIPVFLSGGISSVDTEEIKKLSWLNIHAIDINSKFEVEPAFKDIEKVKIFINNIRNE